MLQKSWCGLKRPVYIKDLTAVINLLAKDYLEKCPTSKPLISKENPLYGVSEDCVKYARVRGCIQLKVVLALVNTTAQVCVVWIKSNVSPDSHR